MVGQVRSAMYARIRSVAIRQIRLKRLDHDDDDDDDNTAALY